ncbi:MAG: hypothetical protein CL897_01125 [Dehalococcoidia bacterium]|nr:hypothetical protein [Dehalococcoidia bacterium]|tara:strand:+ start:1248 stop:2351 length:1104 start_codon:yes stop_codon:yes gene_type:complete
MATELDDYAIHQIVENMELVEGRNPRWVDELWFHVGMTDGSISVAGHVGVYPQTGTMDGAASVAYMGKQYDVRFGRRVEGDRDRREVGGITAEILDPFRAWRFKLEPTEGQPISFDLQFRSELQPMEVAGPVQHRRAGRQVIWDLYQYSQTGIASGSITIEDETFSLDGAIGARERSWGVRPIFGQIPHLGRSPSSIGRQSFWLATHGNEQSAWIWRIEGTRAGAPGSLGDDTGRTRLDGCIVGAHEGSPPKRITDAELTLRFKQDGKRLEGGEISLRDWDDRTLKLNLRPLTTIYSKGLGYGHPDFRHIEHKDGIAQAETHNTEDAATIGLLLENNSGHINPFGIEHLCEITTDQQTSYGVVRLNI